MFDLSWVTPEMWLSIKQFVAGGGLLAFAYKALKLWVDGSKARADISLDDRAVRLADESRENSTWAQTLVNRLIAQGEVDRKNLIDAVKGIAAEFRETTSRLLTESERRGEIRQQEMRLEHRKAMLEVHQRLDQCESRERIAKGLPPLEPGLQPHPFQPGEVMPAATMTAPSVPTLFPHSSL